MTTKDNPAVTLTTTITPVAPVAPANFTFRVQVTLVLDFGASGKTTRSLNGLASTFPSARALAAKLQSSIEDLGYAYVTWDDTVAKAGKAL